MVRLLSIEHCPCGSLRRYQHKTLGVLTIVTMWGADGSADVIQIIKRRAMKGGPRREAVQAAGAANGGKGK